MSYPQPAPGPPVRYGPPQQSEHPQGTTVLTLGTLGIFLPGCCFVAWVLGNQALREVNARPGSYRNADAIRTGRVLGLVMSWLCIASIVVSVVAIVVMLLMFMTSANAMFGSR